ncbi:MAG: tRNA guanosine(34) transglycosylase Tgt [Vicingaceae bacterium]
MNPFKIRSKDQASKARTGTFTTAHGTINTPIFMPVGTAGTVKGIHQRELKEDIKAEIVLGNTYHLFLRPGLEILENAGGLHRFIGWDRPMLTDSGGYQVYSLSDRRKINEEGVEFASHIDGSKHFFTPEYAIDVQRTIGADIIMAFDECTPYPCEYDYAAQSMNMTHRWLDRCIEQFNKSEGKYGYEQFFFPIVQGSTFKDLRETSAEFIASRDCVGNAIGGLSVGEPHKDMYHMTEAVCNILPENKVRYLMGVGTPANLLQSISLGIDMFDCVMPTRNGRNGMLFTKDGILNMRNEKWKNDHSPIEEDGASYVDEAYSKAYLRHLLVSNEMLGSQIASQHNLAFYLWLMKKAGQMIDEGLFSSWKSKMMLTLEMRL